MALCRPGRRLPTSIGFPYDRAIGRPTKFTKSNLKYQLVVIRFIQQYCTVRCSAARRRRRRRRSRARRRRGYGKTRGGVWVATTRVLGSRWAGRVAMMRWGWVWMTSTVLAGMTRWRRVEGRQTARRRQVGRGLEREPRRWPRLDALFATQRASPAARESCWTHVIARCEIF